VVGGHSHTFLYPPSQNPPSIEDLKGEYPTYVQQEGSNRVVPVVQAYCNTKYIGHLEANFDSGGELLFPIDGAGKVQRLLTTNYNV